MLNKFYPILNFNHHSHTLCQSNYAFINCSPTPGQSVTTPDMIVRERKTDDATIFNQNDPPVTISRKNIMIAGETFLIAAKTFLISKTPGSNEDESIDHFIKTITIAGNHKSIFKKRNNTFAKRKNQNDLSGNRSCENILQEAGNKLKTQNIVLSSAGNVLKEDSIGVIISGNKLQEASGGIQEAGNELKEDYPGLKNLGVRTIFVETFRENGPEMNSEKR